MRAVKQFNGSDKIKTYTAHESGTLSMRHLMSVVRATCSSLACEALAIQRGVLGVMDSLRGVVWRGR